MQLLKDRIQKEGRVLPGNIIKVDGFLNHRVDIRLMEEIAKEFELYFNTRDITMVLTAEASGIALAAICAQRYNVPMVFAKKAKSDNIEGGLYQSEIYSYTYKKKVTQILSKEWLTAGDRVLIIDDFMANGEAVRGLCDLVSQAGAALMGVGIAIEKGFQGGGDRLRNMGVNYHALAVIESAEPGHIVFRDDM
ncbi:MAG: xanthine phosphoribosyltransferase [Oscillospiraceae bacterium]|jgi:xanthine phosphoribosyltransferase|nr:xanthine phosphoribosyltransferase [Oscillospiraceae bacterium]